MCFWSLGPIARRGSLPMLQTESSCDSHWASKRLSFLGSSPCPARLCRSPRDPPRARPTGNSEHTSFSLTGCPSQSAAAAANPVSTSLASVLLGGRRRSKGEVHGFIDRSKPPVTWNFSILLILTTELMKANTMG